MSPGPPVSPSCLQASWGRPCRASCEGLVLAAHSQGPPSLVGLADSSGLGQCCGQDEQHA